MVLEVKIENLPIHHALEVYEIMQLVLKREKKLKKGKEYFWVIALNAAHKIINLELISTSKLTSAIVKPMDVLSIPLQKKAFGIMLVHNHPSGNSEPSEEDKDLTDLLIQACKLMNTPILDHLIITESSYYSFKDSGLLECLEASDKYVLPYELKRRHHEKMQEAIKAAEQEIERRIQERLENGLIESAKQREIAIAQSMLQKGCALSFIHEITGLSSQELGQLIVNDLT